VTAHLDDTNASLIKATPEREKSFCITRFFQAFRNCIARPVVRQWLAPQATRQCKGRGIVMRNAISLF
jgi:hypothetical protein